MFSQSQIWNQFFLSDALYNKFVTATSLTDVAALCNAMTNFYSCVDPIFDRCLSPLGWISQGKSPAQAYINDGVLQQWAFICGAGFESKDDRFKLTKGLVSGMSMGGHFIIQGVWTGQD